MRGGHFRQQPTPAREATGSTAGAQSDPTGANITRDAGYDAWGRVTFQSSPYRAGGSYASTQYTYDALSRVSVINPATGGQIGYQYTGNEATVTDQEGKRRRYLYDESGRVSRVTDEDSAGNLTVETAYQYDTLGRLTQIVQGVQTRSFVYDSLGRLISESHPESGTTAYGYDESGNQTTKGDARGVVAT